LRCFDEYVNSVVEQQHAAVKTVRGNRIDRVLYNNPPFVNLQD
jgi:hypothetical protein